jgi:ligand-binding sensor domain-containing protein
MIINTIQSGSLVIRQEPSTCMNGRAESQAASRCESLQAKNINSSSPVQLYLLLLLFFVTSCYGQNKPNLPDNNTRAPKVISAGKSGFTAPWSDSTSLLSHGEQISQYIRRMFQDKDGNIWFGTNSDGVCRYNGTSFVYFTTAEGLSGNAIRGILQDDNGDLWFATDGGVSRYDGKNFTSFTVDDGLVDNDVWSMVRDRDGNFWFGTTHGVSRYDGRALITFPIPIAAPGNTPQVPSTPKLVNSIFQDKAGNIWFGTNGGGAYRYNGKSLTNFSEKDGLCNNFVQCIIEDITGNIWFGTRFGGLSRYDGKTFTSFTGREGLMSNSVWTMLQDRAGNIWLGTTGWGLYRYDGKSFTAYSQNEGLGNNHVQSILEDNTGRLWFGTSGGVYRFNGRTLTNFTREDAGR